jgi:uncharacterized protein
MGYKHISLKMPTGYTEDFLEKKLRGMMKTSNLSYTIERKSLDARNKNNIHWELRILVSSESIKQSQELKESNLELTFRKRDKRVVVVGSGPAGFFAAYVLQKSGYNTTIIERGTDVEKRTIGINRFESTGIFDPLSNYAFGEGGAGTFSDGKLTSRSKRISKERNFILNSYADAGGPEEILYMTHPHLGSDNLKIIVKNLRHKYIDVGGEFLFETQMNDISVNDGKITGISTNKGDIDADYFFIAPGHSSFDTYRMLIRKGVRFHTKNLAIGSRMEHLQEVINSAQWGTSKLPGVKAAEYRLTSKGTDREQVYSFCMCPGGVIVPAAATADTSVVNGMSQYLRNNEYANAACVATVNIGTILNREVTAIETLGWLEKLEKSFYNFSNGYSIPSCSIMDFVNGKLTGGDINTSYPLGIVQAPLWELLPTNVETAMREGLIDFIRKMKGFETGNIMGLESKTSAPIQVERDKSGLCIGFNNLYVIGEGSGFAGGIISSAADGIKSAMNIVD